MNLAELLARLQALAAEDPANYSLTVQLTPYGGGNVAPLTTIAIQLDRDDDPYVLLAAIDY